MHYGPPPGKDRLILATEEHDLISKTGAPILPGTPITTASSSGWTPPTPLPQQQVKVVRDATHERLIKKQKSRMQAQAAASAATSSSQHSTPATSPAKRGGVRGGKFLRSGGVGQLARLLHSRCGDGVFVFVRALRESE